MPSATVRYLASDRAVTAASVAVHRSVHYLSQRVSPAGGPYSLDAHRQVLLYMVSVVDGTGLCLKAIATGVAGLGGEFSPSATQFGRAGEVMRVAAQAVSQAHGFTDRDARLLRSTPHRAAEQGGEVYRSGARLVAVTHAASSALQDMYETLASRGHGMRASREALSEAVSGLGANIHRLQAVLLDEAQQVTQTYELVGIAPQGDRPFSCLRTAKWRCEQAGKRIDQGMI